MLRLRDDFIAIYDYDGSIPASYTCVNGGTAQMDVRWVYQFDNCLVGETLYDGHALQGFPDGPGVYGYTVVSDGIILDHQPTSLIRFSGTGRRWNNCSKSDYIKSWYASNINYEATGTEGELTISNGSTTFDSGFYDYYNLGTVATLAGGFQFSAPAPATDNQTITVQTISEFVYDLDNSSAAAAHVLLGDTGGYFPVGSLRLSTANTELVMDADNGDDDTVDITLTVDGESEAFAQPWSLWGEDLKFSDDATGNAVRTTCAWRIDK